MAYKQEEEYAQNKHRLDLLEQANREREVSDKRYAIKLIETIVFSLIALLCLGIIGALLKIVIIQ